MEVDQLPTKPGPYYWREKDGDEWSIKKVYVNDKTKNLHASHISSLDGRGLSMQSPEYIGGQWLPIPTADELVELQAAKKMMTDLVRAAKKVEGMLEPLNQRDDKHARDFSKAISACEPVTIIRKAKR